MNRRYTPRNPNLPSRRKQAVLIERAFARADFDMERLRALRERKTNNHHSSERDSGQTQEESCQTSEMV